MWSKTNARTSPCRSALEDLLFQRRHGEQIAQRLNGFDQRCFDAYERLDTMGYDERRAILRQFAAQVARWKRDHESRYAIDWTCDLSE